jgi:hypothetical protein
MMPLLVAVVGALNDVGKMSGCLPNRPKEVRVTFVAHPAKRMLPPAGTPLAADHVNGGVTFMADEGVLVYRTEDARKVLVHELLHLYNYDTSLRGNIAVEQTVVDTFNIQLLPGGPKHLGLSECYIDAMACFLQAAWAGRWTRRAHRAALDRHISGVAARVAAHSGVFSFPWSPASRRFREATHAFSYYVCKAALWGHLEAVVLGLPTDPPLRDPAAFAACVIAAVRAWRPTGATRSTASITASLRMTCVD